MGSVRENALQEPAAVVIDHENELLRCAGKLNDINKSYVHALSTFVYV